MNNTMPDKIYLNKYMLRIGMLYPAQPPVDVPEEEYIRKDALLEWIDEYKNYSSGPSWDLLKTHIESL